MRRSGFGSLVFLGIAAGICSPSLLAGEPEVGRSDLPTVLKREAEGGVVDRRIADGVVPTDNETAWHAGLVKLNGQWLAIDQLDSAQANNGYVAKRTELKDSPQKHLQLARWCALNNEPERARAHYFGVLASAPNNAEARTFLGHVLVADTWVDAKELQVAQQEMLQSIDQLENAMPKLKTIVQGMQSPRINIKTDAFTALAKIDAATSLPALELFATNLDDDLAKPLIRKITEVRSKAACEALVRIGLATESADVRRITADAIRKYPESYFVPSLLQMLAGELKIEHGMVMYPNGNLGLSTVVQSELQNRKVCQRMDKMVSVVAMFSSSHSAKVSNNVGANISFWSEYWKVPTSDPKDYGRVQASHIKGSSSRSESAVYVPAVVASSAAENLKEQGLQQTRAVAARNREIQERVNRVCGLLRATTSSEIADEPEMWWHWWNDRNERYQSEKPTAYGYQQEKYKIEVATLGYTKAEIATAQDLGSVVTQYSCLVPGTLIQTASGLRPVEQIAIGDYVLSQDVETAELTLKPVIMTTVRPPKTTLQIKTAESMIDATGGHLWWISGKGWTKTRDLQPGMMLHTATGTTTIESVTPNPSEQRTHNLVVDGFHTYFVGPQRVLSYDNSMLKPTLRTVPGYGLLAAAKAE